MPKLSVDRRIDELLRAEKWREARRVLMALLKQNPKSHWVITQIGVTYYEERKYEKALDYFTKSLQIVADCPLTLWNLAGALDATGQATKAIRIYNALLASTKSPADDPCWESDEWTNALKADCIYRLGVCFGKLGDREKAERCFRQYLDLLLAGIEGIYSAEDVTHEMRLLPPRKNGAAGRELRKAVGSTLRLSQKVKR